MAFLSLSPSLLSKEIRAFLFGQDNKYSYKDKVQKNDAEAFLPLEELCVLSLLLPHHYPSW